jgi:hypothetical protein
MKTMKNLTYGLVVALLALFIIQGCAKMNGVSILKGQLVASKSTIAAGQPDSLLLVGALASDSINWSVTPSGFNTISIKHNTAVVVFNKSGVYTVKAGVAGANPASTSITVGDTVTNRTTSIPLTGDQIILLSNYYKSQNGDTSYVYFTAETTKTYPCANSILEYTQNLDASNNFSINFIDALQPDAANCQSGSGALASGIIAFRQNPSNPYMVVGTYPLTVTLNGTTYTGSIAVSATDINFNWNYTTGVTIVPKHFTR